MRLRWRAGTANSKTGNIPVANVPGDTDDLRASCELAGCPRLHQGSCYAWELEDFRKTAARAHARALLELPSAHRVETALAARSVSARAVRICPGPGDPIACDVGALMDDIQAVRDAGLAVLGFTHGWRLARAQGLQRSLMASCETPEQALSARALGWRPALVLPWDHQGKTFELPDGSRGLVCPAQTGPTDCNACRLCDPSDERWDRTSWAAVGFVDHSRRARARQRRRLAMAGGAR